MHGKEKYVSAHIISSCSNLAGFQWERKLCRYALKVREGIWTVTCVWFDFGSCYVMCQLSINNPIEAIILLENVELDFPAKL